MTEYNFAATCLFGLEKLLGGELDALGCHRTETMDGRVYFRASLDAVARCNLQLRTAERVYLVLGRFPARSFTELFDGTAALPWEDFIGAVDAFPVKGHAIKSTLFSVPDCQSIVKKAIVDRLSGAYGQSWFDETGIKYQVEFFLFKDEAALMIDTSGIALHKRGYRPAANAAPLRETLAAALAMTARPRSDILFWDPTCGSGTIAIEAAMLQTKTAPGLGRQFAAEEYPWIPAEYWDDARDEAISAIDEESAFEVWASDIDPECVSLTKENARRAGVSAYLKVFEADVRTITKPDRRGTIVCNPPYGERLMTPEAVEELYRDMGRCFSGFEPWQIYVLTSHEGFEQLYGRRADKIRRLYNGMIPCSFYQFFRPQMPKKGR
ncbi:MAG: class I SAM-dependent RNA methyltransferase [Ruminococcaceae bacterium]|nr:class I SAM-dependent RNA methyltransferase [Oscillospiraceae bacterium]